MPSIEFVQDVGPEVTITWTVEYTVDRGHAGCGVNHYHGPTPDAEPRVTWTDYQEPCLCIGDATIGSRDWKRDNDSTVDKMFRAFAKLLPHDDIEQDCLADYLERRLLAGVKGVDD